MAREHCVTPARLLSALADRAIESERERPWTEHTAAEPDHVDEICRNLNVLRYEFEQRSAEPLSLSLSETIDQRTVWTIDVPPRTPSRDFKTDGFAASANVKVLFADPAAHGQQDLRDLDDSPPVPQFLQTPAARVERRLRRAVDQWHR